MFKFYELLLDAEVFIVFLQKHFVFQMEFQYLMERRQTFIKKNYPFQISKDIQVIKFIRNNTVCDHQANYIFTVKL